MIYYKAKVGYLTVDYTEFNNINQIVVLDENSYFSILTPGDIQAGGGLFKTPQEGYDFLLENFSSNDLAAVYNIPPQTEYNEHYKYYLDLLNWFPSAPVSCPNSFDYWRDNPTSNVNFCLIVPSLKIIFYHNHDETSKSGSCAKYDETGTITRPTRNYAVPFGILATTSTRNIGVALPFVSNYNSPLDLTKSSNFGYFNFFVQEPSGWAGNACQSQILTNWVPQEMITFIFGENPPPPDGQIITTDPFEPGGNSGEGGGGGDFDNTSTPIEIPDLPSISAASTGFISLFNPSLSQLNELASYLWSDLFEIDGWKKLFADPMDAILGLSILPVAVPSGGTREVKVGNIGTGISLTIAASQFVEVDCGSIDVNEYWGAYLDYEPYTQAQIFLPYIGTRPISVDDIMGKTVRLVYHVDILTGACCCFVKCGDSVLYTYNGQCSIPIPITGANYTSVVNGVISIAASVGSLVATGGASAPIALPSIANSAVNQMKPQVEKSGSISGSGGVLNMQIPYLILIRPRQALPSRQNEFIGYPSLITVQLTELSGYTEVQSIHLENIPATQEELAEIQSLLEGGVIF